MTRKSVLDDIRKENEVYSIRIRGNRKDKADAFYILMNVRQIASDEQDVFHGIKNMTLDLLRKAEIDFEIINKQAIKQNGDEKQSANNRENIGMIKERRRIIEIIKKVYIKDIRFVDENCKRIVIDELIKQIEDKKLFGEGDENGN